MGIRVPNKPSKEVTDIRYMHTDGLKQVVRVMYVTAQNTVRIVWELVKGYIFTVDGSPLRTSDGSFIRTKDQR